MYHSLDRCVTSNSVSIPSDVTHTATRRGVTVNILNLESVYQSSTGVINVPARPNMARKTTKYKRTKHNLHVATSFDQVPVAKRPWSAIPTGLPYVYRIWYQGIQDLRKCRKNLLRLYHRNIKHNATAESTSISICCVFLLFYGRSMNAVEIRALIMW